MTNADAVQESKPLGKSMIRAAMGVLPEDATIAEIAEEAAILQAIEESEEEVRLGQTIPHAEVMERSKKWLTR